MKYTKLDYKVLVLGKGSCTVYTDGERYFIRAGSFTYSGTHTNKNMKMQYVEITKPEEVCFKNVKYWMSSFKNI